jgi:DNA-binding MarR family transcriptional regulator
VVVLTPAGEALFTSLLGAVVAFDQQLSAAFSDRELGTLRKLLARLRANAASSSR